MVSGSKTFMIPPVSPMETRASAITSTISLSVFDDKMKLLSDSIKEIKSSVDSSGEQAKNQDYAKLCGHLKELIASVEKVVPANRSDDEDEDDQGRETSYKETINDIKQNFKVIEDRYSGLAKLACDSAPVNQEVTEKYVVVNEDSRLTLLRYSTLRRNYCL